MRILLDTNVVLDVLLRRTSSVDEAIKLWQATDNGRLASYVVASSVTDIFYVARRAAGLRAAHAAVRACLGTFAIVPVDGDVLRQASALPGEDFEDNVQIVCAVSEGLDAIVTRDPRGFRGTRVPVLSPAAAVERLGL